MIIETGFEQGTEEWTAARIGSVGATGISKIITTKGERSKQRQDYLMEIASQRITGRAKPTFQTYEMAWGHEHELDARAAFELYSGIQVDQCAMIWADEKNRHHVSPDGIMPDVSAGLEIKCPQLKAFVKYVDGGKLPTEHVLQVQGSLAITGWDIWYYMVYFPGLKPMILEIGRDESLISTIKMEVAAFIYDVDKLIERLS